MRFLIFAPSFFLSGCYKKQPGGANNAVAEEKIAPADMSNSIPEEYTGLIQSFHQPLAPVYTQPLLGRISEHQDELIDDFIDAWDTQPKCAVTPWEVKAVVEGALEKVHINLITKISPDQLRFDYVSLLIANNTEAALPLVHSNWKGHAWFLLDALAETTSCSIAEVINQNLPKDRRILGLRFFNIIASLNESDSATGPTHFTIIESAYPTLQTA